MENELAALIDKYRKTESRDDIVSYLQDAIDNLVSEEEDEKDDDS